MWTLANILTLTRIALIPCFVVFYYLPIPYSYIISAIIFGIAIVTDWLDGFVARYLDQESSLGEFLDPVADKLMVAIVLVVVLQSQPYLWMTLPVAIIIGREIAISALREWMAQAGLQKKVAVSRLGKWKTGFQMVSLILLVIGQSDVSAYINWLGVVLLYIAASLTLWSMGKYLSAALPDILEGKVKG